MQSENKKMEPNEYKENENLQPEEAPQPQPEETPQRSADPQMQPQPGHSALFLQLCKSTFSKVLSVPLIMLASALVLQVIAILVFMLIDPDLMEDGGVQILLSSVPMYAVGLPLGYLLIRKMPTVNRARHSLTLKEFLKYFAICLAAMMLGNVVGLLAASLLEGITGAAPQFDLGMMLESSDYLIVLLVVVIIGPIVEELVFRKFMIDRTQQYGTKLSIFVSALSFGLFHGNTTQLFYAFAIGLALGYVYTRTGEVKYTILLHMMLNFHGGFLSLVLTDHADITNPMAPWNRVLLGYNVLTVILVIVGICAFTDLRKELKFARAGMQLEKKEVFRTVYLSFGMIAMFVYFLLSTAATFIQPEALV